MSIPCKFERSILSYDEHEIILRSHHPEIYDCGLDDLEALRQRLRDMRDKERTLVRAKRRETRGKGTSRGASFPGTATSPASSTPGSSRPRAWPSGCAPMISCRSAQPAPGGIGPSC